MFSEFLAGAYVLVFLFAKAFPALVQPPMSYLTSFFLVRDPLTLVLYLFTIVFFVRRLEQKIGTQKFIIAYALAGIVGNLGLFHIGAISAETMGAEAAIMGILGIVVALHPYEIVFEELVPVPAIAAAAFLIIVKFMLGNSVDIIPLLVGMMLGYLWKPRIEHPRPPKPQGPAWRR